MQSHQTNLFTNRLVKMLGFHILCFISVLSLVKVKPLSAGGPFCSHFLLVIFLFPPVKQPLWTRLFPHGFPTNRTEYKTCISSLHTYTVTQSSAKGACFSGCAHLCTLCQLYLDKAGRIVQLRNKQTPVVLVTQDEKTVKNIPINNWEFISAWTGHTPGLIYITVGVHSLPVRKTQVDTIPSSQYRSGVVGCDSSQQSVRSKRMKYLDGDLEHPNLRLVHNKYKRSGMVMVNKSETRVLSSDTKNKITILLLVSVRRDLFPSSYSQNTGCSLFYKKTLGFQTHLEEITRIYYDPP